MSRRFILRNGYVLKRGTDFLFRETILCPIANFSVDDNYAEINVPVTFTDTTVNDPTSWLWDFGDGNTSTLQNPVHTYDTAGSYTVTMTATNECGSDTVVKIQMIFVQQAYSDTIKIEVVFTETTEIELKFNNNYNYDSNIDWGDGNTINVDFVGTDNLTSHTYLTGTYIIEMDGIYESLDFNVEYFHPDKKKEAVKRILSWGDPLITNLKRIYFMYNSALYELPYESSGLRLITGFNHAFGLTDLTTLPNGLFDDCNNVHDMTSVFISSKLTHIPSDLFANNFQTSSFFGTFAHMDTLTEIPSGLFDNLLNVSLFIATFEFDHNITEIPLGLFDDNINVTTFERVFKGVGITEIPLGLFDNNINVTDFNSAFSDAQITEIPEDLFRYNTLVTTFENCLYGTTISTIPDDLFKYNTQVTNFSRIFETCHNITEIPMHLFDNNTAVTNFNESFRYCNSLTGTTPQLWDTSIWSQVTNHDNCFFNTGTLGSNQTTIPADWGGKLVADGGCCDSSCNTTQCDGT